MKEAIVLKNNDYSNNMVQKYMICWSEPAKFVAKWDSDHTILDHTFHNGHHQHLNSVSRINLRIWNYCQTFKNYQDQYVF